MPRRILLLLAALLVAATATLLTQRWLGLRLSNAAAAATPATVEVLVAAQPLETGSVIGPGALHWAHWPADAARGLLQRRDGDPARFNGAVVRSALLAGEPVTAARLVHPGSRGAMAAVLAPGARAVTISVTPASGMAGFIRPGDRVDVLLTQAVAGGGGAERHLSRTILHDIRVLGTDQQGSGGDEPARTALDAADGALQMASAQAGTVAPTTVTLEVTPGGAELVAVAGELGKLSLSLRGLIAGAPASPRTTWDVDASHVLPRAAPVMAPPASPPASLAAAPPALAAAAPATIVPRSAGLVVRGIDATPGEATRP